MTRRLTSTAIIAQTSLRADRIRPLFAPESGAWLELCPAKSRLAFLCSHSHVMRSQRVAQARQEPTSRG